MNEFDKFWNYKNVVDSYAIRYAGAFGQDKALAVNKRIMTSNKISGLIARSRHHGYSPSHLDYLHTINTIPYFIFSRGQTQALAALLALDRWHVEVNMQLNLLSPDSMLTRAELIIQECKDTYM
jgi:hypothetical protein